MVVSSQLVGEQSCKTLFLGTNLPVAGDVVSNFSQITSTQKLPVVARDNWFTFMDAVDINGERLFGGSLGQVKSSFYPVFSY